MSGLSAGLLDRQIVLQTAVTAQSDSGEVTYDWNQATSVTLWAQWIEKGTREIYRYQREGSYIDGVFRTHYISPRPTPEATRVLFDGRIYDVTGVIEIGRAEGVELMVTAHGEMP